MHLRDGLLLLAIALPIAAILAGPPHLPHLPYIPPRYQPDESGLEIRDPTSLPQSEPRYEGNPRTVRDPIGKQQQQFLSLSDALRVAVQNSEVIRVLGGVSASSTGQTIYDVGISATSIETEKSVFDPSLNLRSDFLRNETPFASLDTLDPSRAVIGCSRTDQYLFDGSVQQTFRNGGRGSVSVNTNPTRFKPVTSALNPQARSSLALSYVHPLWQNSGTRVNEAPIVIARINTERSFFQYKDGVQTMINSVIAGYWNLVFARTDLWAREQQVAQAVWARDKAQARLNSGLGDAGDLSQANVLLANLKASLILAQGNVLNQEAGLRNVLGLAADSPIALVPTTPPASTKIEPNWNQLLALAELNRPDIIELKLVYEADQQRILLAKNQTLPRLDANLLYRWNGLEGWMPNNERLRSGSSRFTDWQMGVNFSVPLGFRAARASLRQQELVVARDRANIDQQLHAIRHTLAANVRQLAQNYERYRATQDTRAAATQNLKLQSALWRTGFGRFLEVRQAITEWGNSVSAEAAALVNYNTTLADLERQTGTILRTHGIAFYEERFKSIGPLFLRHEGWLYTGSLPSVLEAEDRYEARNEAAENFFGLQPPVSLLDNPSLQNNLPPPLDVDGMGPKPPKLPNAPRIPPRPTDARPNLPPPTKPDGQPKPENKDDNAPKKPEDILRLPIPEPRIPPVIPDLNRPRASIDRNSFRRSRAPTSALLPPVSLASEPTRVIR